MKKRKYMTVFYFAGFYLLYFFYFATFCKSCWNFRYYNPHLAAFIFGLISMYIIYLILHADVLMVERYKRK